MSENVVEPGAIMPFANAGSAILSGAIVKIGAAAKYGVALEDIAATTGVGPVAVEGVFEIPSVSDLAFLQGDILYFVATAIAEVSTIECVADVAGSLNDTYFYINTPENEYYVWFNADAGGTDPEVAGKTGVEVAISEDDTADTVAAAVKTALDALADMAASVVTDTVTVTNGTGGAVEDPSDSAEATGFTFDVTTMGAAGSVVTTDSNGGGNLRIGMAWIAKAETATTAQVKLFKDALA